MNHHRACEIMKWRTEGLRQPTLSRTEGSGKPAPGQPLDERINKADKNTKMNACKKATSNSNRLKATAPRTLAVDTPIQVGDV